MQEQQYCEILGKLREARAIANDMHMNGSGSLELSLVTTKIDEAIMWRERDIQVKTPAKNESNH
jgi:hypothetical protein